MKPLLISDEAFMLNYDRYLQQSEKYNNYATSLVVKWNIGYMISPLVLLNIINIRNK